jgi:hypothetical protein
MSLATLEKQIKTLPVDCLDEVSHYIEYLLYRKENFGSTSKQSNLSQYFGSVKHFPDGLEAQRGMRDEWD